MNMSGGLVMISDLVDLYFLRKDICYDQIAVERDNPRSPQISFYELIGSIVDE